MNRLRGCGIRISLSDTAALLLLKEKFFLLPLLFMNKKCNFGKTDGILPNIITFSIISYWIFLYIYDIIHMQNDIIIVKWLILLIF